jgi:putative endopeptidase
MDYSRIVLAVVTVLWLTLLSGCSDAGGITGPAKMGSWGVETNYLSKRTTPGDDFYDYVNEGWLEKARFPDGIPRIDSFLELHLQTEKQLETIVTGLQSGQYETSSHSRQILALYESYMDEIHLEELGISPIEADLKKILSIDNKQSIARWMANPMVTSVLGNWVDLHPKHPDRYTLYVVQGGLALPESVYYTSGDPPFPEIRNAYLDYQTGLFERLGLPNAAARAKAVLAFETDIARLHWSPADKRDEIKNYHPMSRVELQSYAPGFEWQSFFDQLGVPDHDEFVIRTDTAVQKIAVLYKAAPLEVLRDYVAFHFVNNQAMLLSKNFADARFHFFDTILEGTDRQRQRDLQALDFINRTLGEPLGRLYVEKYFPARSKQEMESYIPFIKEAFRSRIMASEWMDGATRKEALTKLDLFKVKIGYPDRWQEYSEITISPHDLIGNYQRIANWKLKDEVSKLGGPVRSWEWEMTPQRVNAYYHPSKNEIVFPAAILQPPFFDPNADPAVNFGAIGGVIGHEMGHGFDDQGSRIDGHGILRNWWTTDARAEFEVRTRALVEQFNGYEPISGTRINGQLTLGENIGDLGGLSIAYSAYRTYLANRQKGNAPVLDGFSGDQRFFLSWAQLWRSKRTESLQRKNLLSDPHSPAKYRVNGIVPHIDGWSEAFGVKAGDRLYIPPAERITIW